MEQNPEIADRVKPITTLTTAPEEGDKKGKVEKKSGKRIGYNYIIIKSLKESQKNDVIKCLYIKSLIRFGICVIKEGTYGDSKDKEGRDIRDRLLWQKQLHAQLQDKIRLPRLLGSFEENGNYYLVIERIKGKSLYRVCRDQHEKIRTSLILGNKKGLVFLNYMVQLVELLEKLHQYKVIHRDVSTNNFMIMPSGKMAIIDMELSYSFEQQAPSPPFQLGTYGYMSPQQERQELPGIQDDIFSVGAIFLQVYTGISPGKITTGIPIGEIREKVFFFIRDKLFADLITRCLDPDPLKRPMLIEVKEEIKGYIHDLRNKRARPLSTSFLFDKNQIDDTIQRAVNTLSSPLLADEQKGWFSENIHDEQSPDKNRINKAWYTSFNKGAAGVIYMLSKAHKIGFDTSQAMPHIQKALQLIEEKYIARIDTVSPSLHFGSSGIAASLATAIREELIEPQTIHFEWINQLINRVNDQPGFMYGVAGQGMANWQCQPFLQEDLMQERLSGYVNHLLEIQQKDGSWLSEKRGGKKGNTTRGFARGVSGIVYFLLEYAIQYQERAPLTGAILGLEWLMKKAVHKNETVRWRSSEKKEIAHWWCEGSPGIALAFMKAYSLVGEPIYKKYAIQALLNNPPQLIDTNLSQCHGMCGLGEIYLEAYRVFQQQQWLDRAGWLAQVIMNLKKEHKLYGPYWLVEYERQPIADFMGGNSGVIHFLLRYCHPEEIGFPLLVK